MFARTKRLMLRPGWPEDAPALAGAIGHEDVVMKISRAPWPYTVEHAHAFLNQQRRADEVVFVVTTADGVEPRIIGCIGIHPEGDWHELGYWFTPDVWGRGYATEAGRQVIDIARYAMGIRRLSAGHYVDNPASGRVLAKLGFRPTGRVEQQFCRARGAHVGCVKMTLDLDDDDSRPMPMAA